MFLNNIRIVSVVFLLNRSQLARAAQTLTVCTSLSAD